MHYYLHLHVKLGHPSHQVCVKWLQDNMTTEQIQTRYGKIAAIFCQYCAKAKVKAAPVSKVVVKKSKGFWRQDSPGCCWKISTSCKRNVSYKYELAFVDSATGYIKLYPMTSCAQQSQQNICNGLLIDVKRCKQNLMSLVTQRW